MDALFPIDEETSQSFAVDLDVFQGPFSVLLDLISRKKLDVTEVALAAVTDEFVAFVRSQEDYDLSQVSEFVVVAATLLELKAMRLLPRDEHEEEDLELLEQRDLLFAKLLQYKAFKAVAEEFAARMERAGRSVARDVPIEEEYAKALPEVTISIGVARLAELAAAAFTRGNEVPVVTIDHLHDPVVPVRSQVRYLRDTLVLGDTVSFASLCRQAENLPTVISRFMAVLEMIRAREIRVVQDEPLGPMLITKTAESDIELDEEAGEEPPAAAQVPDTAG